MASEPMSDYQEPWDVETDCYGNVVGIENSLGEGANSDQDAYRTVACVNALAGLTDVEVQALDEMPASAIREAIEEWKA